MAYAGTSTRFGGGSAASTSAADSKAARLAAMDDTFARDPLRDRKGRYAHFAPRKLAITVVKQGILRTAVVLSSAKQPPEVPFENPAKLAVFVADQLWWPVTKELTIYQLERLYEDLAIAYFKNQPRLQGRFVRDPFKAAVEQADTRAAMLPYGATTLERLMARAEVAVHYATTTAPYPSLIRNAAVFTVEEVAAIARRLYKAYRRKEAEKSLLASATESQRVAAQKQYMRFAETPSEPSLAHETADLFVRCAASVLVESVYGGFGTLLLPGVGTMICETIGGLLCWVI